MKKNIVNLSAQKILMVLVVGIFLISLIGAEVFTFDNKLDYTENDMKVTIINTLDLFGDNTLGSLTLTSHSSVDQVRHVFVGKDRPVIYYDFEGWDYYDNGFGDVIFINMNTGKEEIKPYYLARYETYVECPEVFKNGTASSDCTNKERWVRLENDSIMKGDVRIGVIVNVSEGDYYDTILTVAGKEITKHAVWDYTGVSWSLTAGNGDPWGTSCNGTHVFVGDKTDNIVYFYKLDGTYISFFTCAGCSSLTGVGYDPVNDFILVSDRTVEEVFYYYPNGTYTQLHFDTTTSGNGECAGVTSNGTNVWVTDYTDAKVYGYTFAGVGTGSFSTNSGDVRGVTTNNTFIWVQEWDTATVFEYNMLGTATGNTYSLGATTGTSGAGMGTCSGNFYYQSGGTVYVFEAFSLPTDSYPQVVLNSPDNFSNFSVSTVTFNVTVTDNFIVQNVSLLIDEVIVQTNTSNHNGTYYFTRSLPTGYHNWSILAYDNASQLNQSEYRYFNITIVSPTITLYTPQDNYFTTSATGTFKAFVEDDFLVVNATSYIDGNPQGNWEINNKSYNVSIAYVITEGTHSWYIRAFDNDSNPTDSATRTITLDTISPVLSSTNITNASTQILPTNVIWNYNVSDANADSCYYNTSQNTSFVAVTCNSTITTQIVYDGDTAFYYCANDSVGQETCRNAAYNLFYFSSTSTQTTSSLSEGTDITFYLYVNATGLPDTTAYLTYNNTNYSTPIKQEYSSYTKFTQTITIPRGWGNITGINQTAFWVYAITGYGSHQTPDLYSTIYALEVNATCGAGMVLIYNLSVLDEQTQTFIKANSTFEQPYVEVDMDFRRFASTTNLENFSAVFNGTNSINICSNLQLLGDLKYSVYGTISYRVGNGKYVNGSGIGEKVQEFYNIQNFTLQNSTAPRHIYLYDLDNDSSQTFKILFKDENLVPTSDAIIQIQRFYIDEGTYKVVEVPITDNLGETLAHLEQEDVIYNFWVYKEGRLLASFTDTLAKCDNEVLDDCNIYLNAINSIVSPSDFTSLDDFTFNFAWNNTLSRASSLFNVPSGNSAVVVLNASINGVLACTNTSTQVTDTLYCFIPNTLENNTAEFSLWKDNELIGVAYIYVGKNPEDIFGGSQVFLILFLYLTIFGFALSDNPMITGFMFLIGAILAIGINVISTGTGGKFIGYGATFLWLVIAIIIVMVKAGRRT